MSTFHIATFITTLLERAKVERAARVRVKVARVTRAARVRVREEKVTRAAKVRVREERVTRAVKVVMSTLPRTTTIIIMLYLD